MELPIQHSHVTSVGTHVANNLYTAQNQATKLPNLKLHFIISFIL